MKKIEKSHSIDLKNDQSKVLLSTSVGNGALGGGNVKKEGQVIAKGLLTDFDLGLPVDLIGKNLVVRTNGLDINPATNVIPATHRFRSSAIVGETMSFSFPPDPDTEVDQDDGLISYIITYTFNQVQ